MYIDVGTERRSAIKTIINDLSWPIAFFLGTIAFTIPFFWLKTRGLTTTDVPICLASGEPWYPWNGTINQYWDVSTALFITLGNGSYTYPEAKAIDVTWDLLAGRGGQVVAAIMGYGVIRKSLLYTMEEGAIAIPLVHAIYVDKLGLGFLGSALRHLARPFTSDRYSRSRKVPVLRLLSWTYVCTYVLVLPTIMSAMTGYQTPSDLFFYPRTLNVNALVSADIMKPCPPLIVRDGHRIGLPDNAPIGLGDYPGLVEITGVDVKYNTILGYYYVTRYVLGDYTFRPDWSSGISDFSDTLGPQAADSKPVWGICTVTQFHNGCNETQEWWNATHKPDPNLPTEPIPSFIWTNITLANHTYVLQPPPLDIVIAGPTQAWSISLAVTQSLGGYFSNETIADGAVCQPTTQYIWGFSAILLLLFCAMTTLFAATLLALQLEVYMHSRANRSRTKNNCYKDSVYVVQALKEAHDVQDEDQLLRRINTNSYRPWKGGLAVQTEGLPQARLRKWFSRADKKAQADIPLLERIQSLNTVETTTTSFDNTKRIGSLHVP